MRPNDTRPYLNDLYQNEQKSAAVVGPPKVGRNYGGPRETESRIKHLRPEDV